MSILSNPVKPPYCDEGVKFCLVRFFLKFTVRFKPIQNTCRLTWVEMLFRSPFFLSQTLEPVNTKHFSSLVCWYLCLQTDMENGHKIEVQVAPSLSSSFQKQGSIPQVANREVMLEALKLSAELSVGRRRDFEVVSSCFLSCLAFKMSTSLLRTGGGEQQRVGKDHREGMIEAAKKQDEQMISNGL